MLLLVYNDYKNVILKSVEWFWQLRYSKLLIAILYIIYLLYYICNIFEILSQFLSLTMNFLCYILIDDTELIF